jgi:hypothetical protein
MLAILIVEIVCLVLSTQYNSADEEGNEEEDTGATGNYSSY